MSLRTRISLWVPILLTDRFTASLCKFLYWNVATLDFAILITILILAWVGAYIVKLSWKNDNAIKSVGFCLSINNGDPILLHLTVYKIILYY